MTTSALQRDRRLEPRLPDGASVKLIGLGVWAASWRVTARSFSLRFALRRGWC